MCFFFATNIFLFLSMVKSLKTVSNSNLGSLFSNKLKRKHQIISCVIKAYQTMDIIKRSFVHSDCNDLYLMTSLYVTLIRPLLEFALPDLNNYFNYKQLIQALYLSTLSERSQRREPFKAYYITN